ncbi:hypothetical protein EVAR_6538_1 [Eumeta japonica]|uniref:Uncharacterized protein n=1 Tax=Eumeta variegata TaxID=151549 RepID=A0A4C1SSM9_EUMVA|nr:hypothetical protein EVAR_6538_1 [Eumeta japonica]
MGWDSRRMRSRSTFDFAKVVSREVFDQHDRPHVGRPFVSDVLYERKAALVGAGDNDVDDGDHDGDDDAGRSVVSFRLLNRSRKSAHYLRTGGRAINLQRRREP